MTLLLTEVDGHGTLGTPWVIFAADRRISKGGAPAGHRQKVFPVPSLNAGIGYAGIAEVPPGHKPMSEWLQDFMGSVPAGETLSALATRLADALNGVIPAHWQTEPSTFHVSGFNAEGRPEFWYVRNVDDNRRPTLRKYEVREDFQRRDAAGLAPGQVAVYRNGDIRAHVLAWEKIDESLGALLHAPGFKGFTTPAEYAGWVAFKMDLIAQFYERFCNQSIIGGPVDAFAITPHSQPGQIGMITLDRKATGSP